MIRRFPLWVLLALVLWWRGVIPCVNYCPPPELRVWWMQHFPTVWPWCCE